MQDKHKNMDVSIEVITTDIADLAMLGYGSIKNCLDVCQALSERYQSVNLCVIHDQSDLTALVARKPDLIFAGIKYVIFSDKPITKSSQDKIWLADFLDEQDLRYVGSQSRAIELEFDKQQAKAVIQANGIATAPFFVSSPSMHQNERALPLPYPLFVKPLYESDSKGVDEHSVVTHFAGFQAKIAKIDESLKQPAIVESYLPGREFTVSILGQFAPEEDMAMPVEVIIHGNTDPGIILGYDVKKKNQETLVPVADDDLRKKLSDLAIRAFHALKARDLGRIDIKMDECDQPFFLEANLLPGMSADTSYFPEACRLNAGLTYRQLVWRMAEIALNR